MWNCQKGGDLPCEGYLSYPSKQRSSNSIPDLIKKISARAQAQLLAWFLLVGSAAC
jgi:hypothetical protein